MKAPKDCEKLFAYIKVNNFDLRNLDVSGISNCTRMFTNSTAKHIDASEWDTRNVTDLDSMFYFCQQLETLNLKNWNTKNVENSYQFLWYCEKLESVDVSSFNMSKNRDMSRMFGECYSLVKIKGIESFDTSQSGNVAAMFQACRKLKELKDILTK